MGNMSFFENLIENKLKNLHTAYLAKVISVNGNTAKIQPLGLTKAYGDTAKKQSPLSNVPIAAQKIEEKTISVVTGVSPNVTKADDVVKSVTLNVTTETVTVAQKRQIAAGDIVVCICCERDISAAKKGVNSTPALGHHSMSDSVIVGCL